MNNKKILFVLGGLSFGGAERVITILAHHYLHKGWQVTIVTLLKDACDFKLEEGIRHVHFGSGTSRIKQAPVWLKGLTQLIRRERPDAVVSFAARINCITASALLLAGRRHTRLIVSERNDPKHDTRTKPVVLLTELLYPKTDGIVFQTEYARNCFSPRVRSKGCIIANPVTEGLPQRAPHAGNIAAVGKLMPQKNHALLIDAFSQLAADFPDTVLHIYGDGLLRDELQKKIDAYGLKDRVILEGWRSDVHLKVSEAECFVLSSDYEGLSNALLEAYCMGVPCISTDCAGACDVLTDGEDGLIVPVGAKDALTAALQRLLSDGALRESISRTALVRADRFSTQKILTEWETVIEGREGNA